MSVCHFDMTVQLGPQEASEPDSHSALLGLQTCEQAGPHIQSSFSEHLLGSVGSQGLVINQVFSDLKKFPVQK